MYSIDGSRQLKEKVYYFEGYMKSTPVRIGNEAYDQLQLDIYGELMDAVFLYNKHGEQIGYDLWEDLKKTNRMVGRKLENAMKVYGK